MISISSLRLVCHHGGTPALLLRLQQPSLGSAKSYRCSRALNDILLLEVIFIVVIDEGVGTVSQLLASFDSRCRIAVSKVETSIVPSDDSELTTLLRWGVGRAGIVVPGHG